MLFLLDFLIPGKIRERIVIFYIRYKGLSSIESMNDVVKLVRQTGYLAPKNNNGVEVRPKFYPERYFQRFSIDSNPYSPF